MESKVITIEQSEVIDLTIDKYYERFGDKIDLGVSIADVSGFVVVEYDKLPDLIAALQSFLPKETE